MADLFYRLLQNAKSITKAELQVVFPPDVDNSYLMRSIIMSEKNYPSVNYDRSLRSLWYSIVKPTLDKLGKLKSEDMTEESLTKWDATLSRYVADLLRRGYLTYKDLHILDNSRQRENPSVTYYTVNRAIYCYKATLAPYSNIIIATEKDTVYNIIKDIAQLFGCSCISCKGQNSLGAMEDLIRGMKLAKADSQGELFPLDGSEYADWKQYVEDNEYLLKEYKPEELDETDVQIVELVKLYKSNVADFLRRHKIVEIGCDRYYKEKDLYGGADTVYILTMTDYDPAGYYIAEALETQVRDILASQGMSHINVEVKRVGITPDQLDDDLVEANKYSPKPANLEKWLDRTGGIDGEPMGLELDALEPTEIRRIFVRDLINLVDPAEYETFVKEAYIRKRSLEVMALKVEKAIRTTVGVFEEKLILNSFDMEELAINGDAIITIDGACEDTYDEEIAQAILKYFV